METDTSVFVYNGGPIPDDIDEQKITHIHVNEGVTSIPNRAFRRSLCLKSVLQSVFVADGVTRIGDYAFSRCNNLISIRLPDSLEIIGEHAFWDCTKLEKIQLPSNIRSMGEYSFYNCSSLTSIDIPSSMTSIANRTFSKCRSLSKVNIPTSVSTLGEHSFSDCHSMVSIKLHGAIQHIGQRAFEYCTSLLSIQIPPSTTTIGDFTFAFFKSLKIAYFPYAAIEGSDTIFSSRLVGRSNYNPNLILLTDRDDFIYRDYDQGDVPTFNLRAIQQCIHSLPNINNYNDDDDVNGDYTSTSTITTTRNTTNTTTTAMATIRTITATTTTTIRTRQQQQLQALHQVLHDHHPDIAQRAQQSGLNLLHLLVYFPGDILQPLTMLLDKCPLVTTAVDNTGRTPFHHTITSTQQNMDSACYDLLASRSPDGVAVHLAIRSGAPWHEVYDIVEAKVNGLGVEDEKSGLMPFMMAAVKDDEDENDEEDEDGYNEGRGTNVLPLTAIYELLCMKPDVMNEYIVVGSGGSGNKMACVGDGAGRIMKRRRFD